MKLENHKSPKRGYWYMFTHYKCPVCCKGSSIKERVYDSPKPENWFERHEYFQDPMCVHAITIFDKGVLK